MSTLNIVLIVVVMIITLTVLAHLSTWWGRFKWICKMLGWKKRRRKPKPRPPGKPRWWYRKTQ